MLIGYSLSSSQILMALSSRDKEGLPTGATTPETSCFYDLENLLRALGAATRRDPLNQEGRTLWKLDLKDAYRHVVVEQGDARLLGYFWPGLGYLHETQLSFGGRSAPFIFNLFAEGFEWILRSFGVECDHYLDDSFGWVEGRARTEYVLDFVSRVASMLGLRTAPHKTLAGDVLEILGVTIDVSRGIAYISEEKRRRILEQLRGVRRSTDMVEIQSLAGSLVFVTRVCLVGRAFLRRVFDQIRVCRDNPFIRRRVSQGARRELDWWDLTLTGRNTIRYLADDPSCMETLQVWSDASGSNGIGGHLVSPDAEFSERIPLRHARKDIMFKEALAVLRCVELWSDRMSHKLVIFHVDNQALVAALNQGSCHQRSTQAIIRRVYTLAAWRSFFFQARWISTHDNKRADALSRFISIIPSAAATVDLSGAHFDPDCVDSDDDAGDDNGLDDVSWLVDQYAT